MNANIGRMLRLVKVACVIVTEKRSDYYFILFYKIDENGNGLRHRKSQVNNTTDGKRFITIRNNKSIFHLIICAVNNLN